MAKKDKNEATVVKANSLIQAGYRLSLAEQQVMLSAISRIGIHDHPTEENVFSIHADALRELTGVTQDRAYKALAAAAHRLYKREVRIEGGPNGETTGPQAKRVVMTRWVQEVAYLPHEGRIELRFSHSILPYISRLREEFTSYKMREIAQMRSTHGIRLYEILQQWLEFGERRIEIEDLRKMFGVEGQYKSIKDLKARVIEPAIKDVNRYSDLEVDWSQQKRGRRVAAITFHFHSKRQKRIEGRKTQKKRSNNGEGPWQAANRHYTVEDLRANPHLAKPGETFEAALTRLNKDKVKKEQV